MDKPKFSREQLIFIVETIINTGIGVSERHISFLRGLNSLGHYENIISIEAPLREAADHLSEFYNRLNFDNDSLGFHDAYAIIRFSDVSEKIREGINLPDYKFPPIDCRSLAEKFVDEVFARYLGHVGW